MNKTRFLFILGFACAGVVAVFLAVFSYYGDYRKNHNIANCGLFLYQACVGYAGSNQGKYPASLEDLVDSGLLDRASLDEFVRPKGGDGRWEYLGKNRSQSDRNFAILNYVWTNNVGVKIEVNSMTGVNISTLK